VGVARFGPDALNLVFRMNRRIGERLKESGFDFKAGRAYAFDADGGLYEESTLPPGVFTRPRLEARQPVVNRAPFNFTPLDSAARQTHKFRATGKSPKPVVTKSCRVQGAITLPRFMRQRFRETDQRAVAKSRIAATEVSAAASNRIE
jgi:hypothetical protein